MTWLVLRGAPTPRGRELPAPDADALVIDEQAVPLVWRGHYVAALFAENRRSRRRQLENKGFEVVVLGENEASWAEPTSALAKLLGRSA